MTTKLHTFLYFICSLFIFSACQKEFTDEVGNTGGTTPAGNAGFVLSGTPGNCTSPLINGVFQAGTPMDSSNYITVQVQVTSAGTFTISDTAVNGITLSASGTFLSTGLKTVNLKATGTPLANGLFNFTLGEKGCTFSISFLAGAPAADCKACSYFPLCVGSKYAYLDTTSGIGTVSTKDLLSSVDTTIDNRIYQKITAANGIAYYNCTNGETTVVGYQVTSINGNTLQKIMLTMLKANEDVGVTWADTITNPSGQSVIQKFKITGKGISKDVGTFSFPDVIAVNLETGLDIPGIGYEVAATTNYYYAKGVGLVETITQDPGTGQVLAHSVIKSYLIP